MANDMFTNRSGHQVAVPDLVIPKHEVVSLMRLQEDYTLRGEHLSLLGVMLDVIDKGKRQVKNQWKNGDLSKNRRDFAKAVVPFMANPAKYAKEIQALAKAHGLVNGTIVDLSAIPEADPETDNLTEDQLEAATAPNGGN
jgi:hypothetical protein